ncbi:MAG TPA: GAF domain-containing protein, partial [Acidimicrobiales bacterium]|nr:GAF domain-containing protein [Acidimicrobiales bacterium]
VPVVTSDRVVGVLHSGSFKPAFFGPAHVAALEIVAGRLAAAMERAERFASERSAKQQAEHVAVLMGRLQKITAALSSDMGVRDAARTICRQVTESSMEWISGCTMWIVAEDALELVQPDEAPVSARSYERMPLSGDYPGCEVVRTNRPLWIESPEDLEGRFPTMAGAKTLGDRFAVLPLRSAAGAFGVLAYSFSQASPFAEHERAFLLAVADQASQAFDRARLRDVELRAAEHEAVLAHLSGALSSSLDPATTTAYVVDSLVPGLADVAAVHLFDAKGTLTRAALRHAHERVHEEMLVSQDTDSPAILAGLAEVTARRELTVIDGSLLDSAATGTDLTAQVAEIIHPLRVTSALVLRLSHQERIIGVLSIARLGRSEPFDKGDYTLYVELARRAAVAIANAQLHSELTAGLQTERFLLGVAGSLAGATGYIETLQRLATAVVPALADMCLIDLLNDAGDGFQRVLAHHADPKLGSLVRQLWHRYPPDIEGEHPSATVLRQARPIYEPDVTAEMLGRFSRDEEHLAIMQHVGWRSFVAVPLLATTEVIGTLVLVRGESGRPFEEADVGLVARLGAQVGAVVGQARR